MTTERIHIFVSYSHVDRALVTPIVQVMRTIGSSLGGTVFQDIDSIPAGKRWRPIIENSIDQASFVFVFWCVHSSGSAEVAREWRFAIQAEKDVCPTILDDTPMHPTLAEYQSIDLRALAASHARRLCADRNLVDGENERIKDQYFHAERQNHVLSVDLGIINESAMHMLGVVERRGHSPVACWSFKS